MKLLAGLFFGSLLIQPTLAADSPVGETEQYVSYCRLATSVDDTFLPTTDEAIKIGFCFGLLDGLRGANYYLKRSKSEAAFCEPEKLKNDELAVAFVRSVEKHPDLKPLRGALGALLALRAAFPCDKPKS